MPEQDGNASPTAKQRATAFLSRPSVPFEHSPGAGVPPACAISTEVRFAVVMYGGVSLAIYINGVSQELFRLVRATAARRDAGGPSDAALFADSALTSTERVYRRLAQFLGDPARTLEDIAPDDPIRARFVVDVISGTSAGGINGIVLAKALANQQEINQLKQLWMDEGDIAKLINDAESLDGVPLTPQDPPRSLLNSQRMYLKLLDAFEGMENPVRSRDECVSPYVEELDLFVTTTDIRGLTVPLKLADRVVFERRHRNVFHLLYATKEASGTDRNDFHADNNPFLAFAARCTSAFPFAFEPMTLDDIAPFAPYQGDPEKFRRDLERWKGFYKDYLNDPQGLPFSGRSFGDGGYLDNKPFSYATESLLRRSADTRVDRKLIYVEPSPEHPEATVLDRGKPDVIANVMAALLVLPAYETIREDIQRVLERNRLIERVNRVANQIERDIAPLRQSRQQPEDAGRWADRDLTEMIRTKGASYGGYHRLKVAALTDELAELMTRLVGLDEESDRFLAIRYLVRAWRERAYVERHSDTADTQLPSQNRLLIDLDLSYRLRRVNFLRAKIDELYPLDQAAEDIIRTIDPTLLPMESRAAFQEQLLWIKRQLGDIFVQLRRLGRNLRAGKDEGSNLPGLVSRIGLTFQDLDRLLGEPTELRRQFHADGLLRADDRRAGVQNVANELAAQLRPAFIQAAAACEAALGPDATLSRSARAARRCLSHYYTYYEDYDMVTFPILYGTGVGEADAVEIIRISPEDATSLIDEKKDHPRKKLDGIALFHFGAFLERLWRRNDMMWGRLDGAERIITAVLAEHPEAARKLIREAHRAIIAEELPPKERDELYRELIEEVRRQGGTASEASIRDLLDTLDNQKVRAFLDVCLELTDERLREEFQRAYPKSRGLVRDPALRSAARATTVVGKMLEGLAAQYQTGGKPIAAWITRLGQVFWGMTEVALPRSIWNPIFHYWLNLFYVFELFLIAGGLVLSMPTVQQFGLLSLAITIAIHTGVFLLGGYMMRGRTPWRIVAIVGGAVILVLAVIGGFHLRHLLDVAGVWPTRASP